MLIFVLGFLIGGALVGGVLRARHVLDEEHAKRLDAPGDDWL